MVSVKEVLIHSPVDTLWEDVHHSEDGNTSESSFGSNKGSKTNPHHPLGVRTSNVKASQGPPPEVASVNSPPLRSMLKPDGLSDSSQDGLATVIPVPVHTPSSAKSGKKRNPQPSSSATKVSLRPKGTLYCPNKGDPGPHCYKCCPRKSAGMVGCDKETTTTTASTKMEDLLNGEKPPFVVRRVDQNLISKRDFPLSRSKPLPSSSTRAPQPDAPVSSWTQNRKKFSQIYDDYLLQSPNHMTSRVKSPRQPGPVSMSHKHLQPSPAILRPQTTNTYTAPSEEDTCEDVLDLSDLQGDQGNIRNHSTNPSLALRERISLLMDECCECRVRLRVAMVM